jgi:hypothetical protein
MAERGILLPLLPASGDESYTSAIYLVFARVTSEFNLRVPLL